jgi:hypothetical protein
MKGSTVLCGPVPIVLASLSDPTVGVASCPEPVTLALGSHDIDVHVEGYHAFSGRVAQVEIDRATHNYLAGGGYLSAWSSGGSMAAEDGSRVSFGFRVRFNPRLTNVRGHANVLWHSGGTTYQVRNRDIEWIALGSGSGVASFGTPATLSNVDDPLAPMPLGGSVRLVVWVTDRGDTGDRIAIAVYRGDALLFASRWDGAPVKKNLAGGGITLR